MLQVNNWTCECCWWTRNRKLLPPPPGAWDNTIWRHPPVNETTWFNVTPQKMRQHDSGSLRNWLSTCLQRGDQATSQIWPPDKVTSKAVDIAELLMTCACCTKQTCCPVELSGFQTLDQLKTLGLVPIDLNWKGKLKIDPTQFVKLIDTNQGNFHSIQCQLHSCQSNCQTSKSICIEKPLKYQDKSLSSL